MQIQSGLLRAHVHEQSCAQHTTNNRNKENREERKTTHYKQIKFTIASVYFNFNNSGIDVLYMYIYCRLVYYKLVVYYRLLYFTLV